MRNPNYSINEKIKAIDLLQQGKRNRWMEVGRRKEIEKRIKMFYLYMYQVPTRSAIIMYYKQVLIKKS